LRMPNAEGGKCMITMSEFTSAPPAEETDAITNDYHSHDDPRCIFSGFQELVLLGNGHKSWCQKHSLPGPLAWKGA
jgi:hypothetical protein